MHHTVLQIMDSTLQTSVMFPVHHSCFFCGNAWRYWCPHATQLPLLALQCASVHLKSSSAWAKIPLPQYVDQVSCHIRIPWKAYNGLVLYYMSRNWPQWNGMQGNASNLPRSTFWLTNACSNSLYILAKLYCGGYRPFTVTDEKSFTLAIHTAAGHVLDLIT